MIDINNVFSPGSAIESIQEFAGRQVELMKAVSALRLKGASLVLYGYRGVGKSSLAQQISAIAKNDPLTLERVNAKQNVAFDFNVVFISAAFGIKTTEIAILSLLSDDAGLRPYLTQSASERVDKFHFGVKSSLINAGASSDTKSTAQSFNPQIPAIFKNAVNNAFQKTGKVCLIIIDEFDKIADQTGFAEFMKYCENLPVKFCIVGISDDVSELLRDHSSIARQIRDGSIYVPPMTKPEQLQIFEKAHEKMSCAYTFSDPAMDFICQCSQGHPYIIHKLGFESLKEAAAQESRVVTEK